MDQKLTTWKDHAKLAPCEDSFTEITVRLANGEHLKDILQEDHLPTQSTFHKWINQDPEWSARYFAAQEAKMHTLAEETLDIADNTDTRDVKKAELQVKARQWLVERLARKNFADPSMKGAVINGDVNITNNSIHALLTEGTDMGHVIEHDDDPEENIIEIKDVDDGKET